jgi:molybdate transport system ATP-binding protein
MKTQRPFFKLSHVTLRLDNRLVFHNICWTFARNQHWALVGPNGAGKTLLACSIAGELPFAKGDVHYGFRVPAGKLPEDCVVLVSFEKQKALAGDSPAAVRWFSVEQEQAPPVKQFLSQDSIDEINPFEVKNRSAKSAADFNRLQRKLLSLLKLSELMDRPLPSLSNGEMRKILLARALLKRPRLLILDDVFAGLDVYFRSHLKDMLEKIMAQGTVRLLLVESQPANLPEGITHMLYVNRLRLVAQGSRRDMERHPGILELLSSRKLLLPSIAKPCLLSAKPRQERGEIVRMENVSVCYGRREILSGIDWTIRHRESWALVGPNGSGKSTLLSLISGDNPQAYANGVYLFGRRRGSGESIWNLKKRIGWISSELHLHFPQDQTCLETIISGFYESAGCFRKITAQQRRMAQKMLSRFALGRLGQSPFGSLSAGLQRMMLLARALVKCPDLLLLDEPCQGLDSAHRDRFLTLIGSLLRASDTTIVYVTHISDEIPNGIHKILQLRDGRVFRSGRIPKNRKIVL